MLKELESGEAIASATDRLLREAGAYGRFPTPVEDIVAAAKLSESTESLFSDGWLKRAPARMRSAIARLKSKVRAALDRRERIIYLNPENIGSSGGEAFKRLHEVTHDILPWQKELAYADDDLTLSWPTRMKFEQEANQGAAELLFQRDLFSRVAADFDIGLGSVVQLSQKIGGSIHATLRRYVETHEAAVAGVVFNRPALARVTPRTIRRREAFSSPSWRDNFSDPRAWPKHLHLSSCQFLPVVLAAFQSSEIASGKFKWPGSSRSMKAEALFNSYSILTLIWQPAPRRWPRRKSARVLVEKSS